MSGMARFRVPPEWRPDEPVFAFHEDSNANAAMIHPDGTIYAVAEERLTRRRFQGGFPKHALAWIERESGVRAADASTWVFGNRTHFLPRLLGTRFPSSEHDLFGAAHKLMLLYHHACFVSPAFASMMEGVSRLLLAARGRRRVTLVDHHLAHAASAYYTSGFDDAVAITADNFGDGYSAKVFDCSGGAVRFAYGSSALNSPGQFYGEVAQICGIHPLLAGKLTGMAAHGDPRRAAATIRPFFDVERGGRDFTRTFGVWRSRGTPPFPELGAHARYDIAAATQRRLEDALIEYVRAAIAATGRRNVALAGGCFANVRVNQEIMRMEGVDAVWIHPAMSDQGIALGAALHAIAVRRHARPFELESVFLGPAPTEAECEAALREAGIPFTRPGDIAAAAADRLAAGQVVARVDGAMEYGPRALGNRSIFTRTTDPTIGEWLNKKLRRAHYMPFAPITMEEHAPACFRDFAKGVRAGRFMTIAYDAHDEFRRVSPGGAHVDGTARPQLLRERDNPGAYAVLAAYHRRTGIPSLINTSFNMHEEPIVCGAGDAVRAFVASGIDAMILGPFLAVR